MILTKRYDEIMDRVQLTEQARQRILSNVQNADLSTKASSRVIRFPNAKRYLSIAACLAILLIGMASFSRFSGLDVSPEPTLLAPGNPITEMSSAQELSDAVGFEINDVSTLPFTPEEAVYTAYFGELGEITYQGEGKTACYRKSMESGDNSGDHNTYPSQSEIQVGDSIVTLKGAEEDYVLAIWSDGEFSYSILLSEGVSIDVWSGIVSSVLLLP